MSTVHLENTQTSRLVADSHRWGVPLHERRMLQGWIRSHCHSPLIQLLHTATQSIGSSTKYSGLLWPPVRGKLNKMVH